MEKDFNRQKKEIECANKGVENVRKEMASWAFEKNKKEDEDKTDKINA